MSKPPRWKNNVKKSLESVSLTYEKLYNNTKKSVEEDLTDSGRSIGDYPLKRPERDFKKALIQLLDDGKIRISGYDTSIHKHTKGPNKGEPLPVKDIAAFKIEGLKFKLVKNDEIYIHFLLKKVDTSDSEEHKNELETIFHRKFKEYIEEENDFYNSLIPRVKSYPAGDVYENKKENLFKKGQNLYNLHKDKLKDLVDPKAKPGNEWMSLSHPVFKDDATSESISVQLGIFEDLYRIRKILTDLPSKFKSSELTPESKIWMIPDITQGEAMKITINKYSKRFGHRDAILDVTDEFIKKKSEKYFAKKLAIIDVEGVLTRESYIDKHWNYTPELPESSISELFNTIMFFINTHENYEVLKKDFSLALSDREGSRDWFELFVNKVMSEDLYFRFQKGLGIKSSREPNQDTIERLTVAIENLNRRGDSRNLGFGVVGDNPFAH